MAVLIPADAEPTIVQPAHGRSFTLQELQTFVGGYIEAVAIADQPHHVMFVNEDGKRLELPVNEAATALVQKWLRFDDYIVGTAVVCTRIEAGEETE